ncbi:M20/M25/M40 family metallo-hydrolase [Burkholderia guangdongensis]|uniref:M20/M25/M40 family metallo-hydrolase n=1 Tax=Burkholderia guangdongensis TaxID=1792500 RepID=UPI0015C89CFA
MNRNHALERVADYFDSGAFLAELNRRVAYRTESEEAGSGDALAAYLAHEVAPSLRALGFDARVVDNPVAKRGPFLVAHRHEGDDLPTVLTYGHGDVVRGQDGRWRDGRDPWRVSVDGERWYGRGTADNKGQHTINLAALRAVLDARGGRLGFNTKMIFEMGEEMGSPGLREVCAALRDELAADVFVASDGPRVTAGQPTVFLGSRGVVSFDLHVNLRDSAHHSGHWGGALRNPGVVLANAIASLVDGRGRIKVAALRPLSLPDAVRRALADVGVGGGPDDPDVDADYGEPGLTPAERVFGWNTLEVLAFETGNPAKPVSAIPGRASASCQLCYVVGTDSDHVEEALRAHLDRHGFECVDVAVTLRMAATRLDSGSPWVDWASRSIARTLGAAPVLLPNIGGAVPNDIFSDLLGLPTLWVPHSYPGCRQHAPDEHLLGPVAREGLRMMAGLFWDLGDAHALPRVPRESTVSTK